MCSNSILSRIVSRRQKEVKMSLIKAEITGDLNGSKSD